MSFSVAANPFDDFKILLSEIKDKMQHQDDQDQMSWLNHIAEAKGEQKISAHRSLIALFASSNGIEDDVNLPLNRAEIREFMDQSASGFARINDMCGVYGHGLRIFDLALDMPTKPSFLETTLGEKQCAATIAFGMEAIAAGADILSIGTVATGADQVAASIILAIEPSLKSAIEEDFKVDMTLLERILVNVSDDMSELQILAQIGSREISAMIGAIIAARTEFVPVILDDLSSLTAALILHKIEPKLINHCRMSIPVGQLQNELTQKIGLQSVLLSDSPEIAGARSALAMGVIKANVAAL